MEIILTIDYIEFNIILLIILYSLELTLSN